MEKTEKRVGIILVNYNGIDDTIDCLKSLLNNTFQETEVIVVDNCSTDNSAYRLNELENELHFKLICAPVNNGFSAGNNIGIKYALKNGCTHVLLLNNDTMVTSSFLSELMLHDDGNTVLTGTILYYYKKNIVWYAGGKISKYTAKTEHFHLGEDIKQISKETKEISFASGCEMLIPKQIIENIGLMDEDYFLYGEDTDYSLRITNHGFKMLYVPTSLIYHKVGASTSKISKATQYYSARNRRILIYRNFNWFQRLTALIYTHIQTVSRIIKGRLTVKCVISGISDYYQRRLGKTSRCFD